LAAPGGAGGAECRAAGELQLVRVAWVVVVEGGRCFGLVWFACLFAFKGRKKGLAEIVCVCDGVGLCLKWV